MKASNEISDQDMDVPNFDVQNFGEKSNNFVLIIPVINEGERVRHLLNEIRLKQLYDAIDIVIVDGGSTDGSLGEGYLGKCGVRALLTKTAGGKLSAQLRCAYAWALSELYTGIVTIDGNGKDDVSDVQKFIDALAAGYDYAQASRFIKGGKHKNTPLNRLTAIRLIHSPILSLASGFWFSDTTQGFRAYSSKYLGHHKCKPFRPVFQNYELLAYLTVRARQLDLKVIEIPTTRIYPQGEVVPTKINGLAGLSDLMLVVLGTLLRVYHPKTK